jgi:hypothetical protein
LAVEASSSSSAIPITSVPEDAGSSFGNQLRALLGGASHFGVGLGLFDY